MTDRIKVKYTEYTTTNISHVKVTEVELSLPSDSGFLSDLEVTGARMDSLHVLTFQTGQPRLFSYLLACNFRSDLIKHFADVESSSEKEFNYYYHPHSRKRLIQRTLVTPFGHSSKDLQEHPTEERLEQLQASYTLNGHEVLECISRLDPKFLHSLRCLLA